MSSSPQACASSTAANYAGRPWLPRPHEPQSRRASTGVIRPRSAQIAVGAPRLRQPKRSTTRTDIRHPAHRATHFTTKLQHLINSSQTRCFPRAHRIESIYVKRVHKTAPAERNIIRFNALFKPAANKEVLMKLGFIGCGNMAKAMIKGIVASGAVAPGEIYGSNVTPKHRCRSRRIRH